MCDVRACAKGDIQFAHTFKMRRNITYINFIHSLEIGTWAHSSNLTNLYLRVQMQVLSKCSG
jgi:hypothetical protein